jgi:hypothetical protein
VAVAERKRCTLARVNTMRRKKPTRGKSRGQDIIYVPLNLV